MSGKITAHPRVVVQIAVDGNSLDTFLRHRLINLTHTDNRGFEADTVDLDLDDSDGALDLPPRGAVLELAFGWEASGLVAKGKFTVAEVGHDGTPDVLRIRATSADLGAGLTTQRERSFDGATLGGIVQTIADENGLKSACATSLSPLQIDHIDQTNESSANFLTRLGTLFDAIATVKDGRLLFIPAGGGITASGQPIPTVVITRKSGDHHNFLITDRQTYQSVRARYNDLDHAVLGEIIWGDNENDAERAAPPKPIPAPAIGQYKLLPTTYPTRKKAERAAQAAWKNLKANKAARAAYVGIKAKYNDRNLSASGEILFGKADEERKSTQAKNLAQLDKAKVAAAEQPVAGTYNAFERSADNIKTLRHVYSSRANAQRAARAEWRRLQRGMATFNITLAEGIPELFPETPAIVSGWKPQIDSTNWLITKVTNTISADGGYGQRLDFEIKATEIPD